MSAHQGTTREGPPPISCHKKCYPLHDEFGVFGFASCGEQLQPCDFGPNCYAWCFDCEARQSAIDPARVPQGVSNDVSNAASRNESEVDGKRVVATAAGRSHTVALVEGGEAWAWGSNSLNELGDGTNTKRSAPVQSLEPPVKRRVVMKTALPNMYPMHLHGPDDVEEAVGHRYRAEASPQQQ